MTLKKKKRPHYFFSIALCLVASIVFPFMCGVQAQRGKNPLLCAAVQECANACKFWKTTCALQCFTDENISTSRSKDFFLLALEILFL